MGIVAQESEPKSIPITAIRIDLREHSVTLEAPDGPLAKLAFSKGTILFQGSLLQPPHDSSAVETTASEDEASAEPQPRPERGTPVILSGRLKSRPRPGRPDAQRLPTAWARLAVHEENRAQAHVYSATFHRASALVALRLALNAPVTVEGYPHTSNDPEGKRLDTLSVFRFINHPADRPQQSGG